MLFFSDVSQVAFFAELLNTAKSHLFIGHIVDALLLI